MLSPERQQDKFYLMLLLKISVIYLFKSLLLFFSALFQTVVLCLGGVFKPLVALYSLRMGLLRNPPAHSPGKAEAEFAVFHDCGEGHEQRSKLALVIQIVLLTHSGPTLQPHGL